MTGKNDPRAGQQNHLKSGSKILQKWLNNAGACPKVPWETGIA
jgi:hypothetical protein